MFGLLNNRHTLQHSGLFNGFVDCHSHILPAVDDGVKCNKEAIETLKWYESLGVKRIIFTPHIMEDYPANNASNLRQAFNKFIAQYSGGIELSLGAEYMLDATFEEHFRGEDLLPIYNKQLLIECSYAEAPINFLHTLQEIMRSGYFVILAHPERYLYLGEREYQQLKSIGVSFQLNLPSILGAYGRDVKRRAEQLLSYSMYDILGSDLHSLHYHTELFNTAETTQSVIARLNKIKLKTSLIETI